MDVMIERETPRTTRLSAVPVTPAGEMPALRRLAQASAVTERIRP